MPPNEPEPADPFDPFDAPWSPDDDGFPFGVRSVNMADLPEEDPRSIDVMMGEAFQRENIATLLAEYPDISAHDIANSFYLWSSPDSYHCLQRGIGKLILEKPLSAGIAEFVAQMRERLSKVPSAVTHFDSVVNYALINLLRSRRNDMHGSHDSVDTEKVLAIVRTAHVVLDLDAVNLAREQTEEFSKKYPLQAADYFTAFGIEGEDAEKHALDLVWYPPIIASLRENGIFTRTNNDEIFRTRVLEIIEANAQFGRDRSFEEWKTSYEIPDDEFNAALRRGFIKGLSLYMIKSLEQFTKLINEYGLVVDMQDPAIRTSAFAAVNRFVMMGNAAEARKIHDYFGITDEEMRPSKEEKGSMYLDQIVGLYSNKETIDTTALADVAAVYGFSQQEIKTIVLEKLEKQWNSDFSIAKKYQQKLLAANLLTAEDATSLRRDIAKNMIRKNADYFKTKEILEGFVLPFCDAEESVELATDRYLMHLQNGEAYRIKQLQDFCDLSLVQQNPECGQRTAKGYLGLLERKTLKDAEEFVEFLHIKEAALFMQIDLLMRTDPVLVLNALEQLPGKMIQQLEARHYLKSYVRDLNVAGVGVYKEYCRLTQAKDVIGLQAYITTVKQQIDGLISGSSQDPDVVNQPNYKELIEIVFANNSGASWTTFEKNERCPDRSADLKRYKIRTNYSFTVAPGSDMVLREGRTKNEEGFRGLHSPVESAVRLFAGADFDREKMLQIFDGELQKDAVNLQPQDAFVTREEKLFGLLLEQASGKYSSDAFKKMMIAYQYAEFEDIRQYVEGTRGRAEQSRNPEYAYLLELREFFADRLKEVSSRICERALQNPALQALLPEYFRKIAEKETARVSGGEVGKLQLDKLGLSESFLKQIGRTLKQRTNRDYTSEEVRTLIRDYEVRTAGMAEAVPAGIDLDPAIYGQIRSQREKTIRALETLSGTAVHPSEIRLDEIDLQQYLNQRRAFAAGAYDEKAFATYITHSFGSVFRPELDTIDEELAKYEPKDGENKSLKPKRVEAFITKNHTSAHARATAGVCVAGDNPGNEAKEGDKNLWEMPNFFQMVLRDAETKTCKGCVILHMEEDGGKKILTASMNPSSTYLYQVNEEEMFRQLRQQLITFAQDNDVDAIALSQNVHIRTNRTGGLFEMEMKKSINTVNKQHEFTGARVFSHRPVYQQDKIDFIWVKEGAV